MKYYIGIDQDLIETYASKKIDILGEQVCVLDILKKLYDAHRGGEIVYHDEGRTLEDPAALRFEYSEAADTYYYWFARDDDSDYIKRTCGYMEFPSGYDALAYYVNQQPWVLETTWTD